MLAKRIIPCLDIKNGRVVKGINFNGIKEVGDPVSCAKEYNKAGADELVFLDILASHEGRDNIYTVVSSVAKEVFIPLTVGGGIKSVDDFAKCLASGADKVAVNSAAITDNTLIKRAADKFGSQCVVVALDVKLQNGYYILYLNGGRISTGINAIEFAYKAQELGAGELLVTSMDADGTKNGFDIELTRQIVNRVKIPVIASGGCGKLQDFADVFELTQCEAALAASIFHYKESTITEVKEFLHKKSIPVRRVK